ncbi:MAG TPA: putative sulfate exporter family transporter [Terriglobales bacterium]|nr:putative sulfate exporter family transporter [Terriglobales bacterium]
MSSPLLAAGNQKLSKGLFLAGLLFVLTPWASPPLALALGLVLGLTVSSPFRDHTRRTTTGLLQASVVGLGFGMNLHQVLKAGRSGFLYTALSISFALAVGLLLARVLRVKPTAGFLISTGTAICGGSAIAAVGPVAGANEEEMSVALGTVFILNSVALLTFPWIGAALHLSQTQFGLWAALAIHDTSSVVGAAAKYGSLALAIGTTVKLARALWIVPMCLGTAAVKRSEARIKWPWFIGLFLLAAVASSLLPVGAAIFHGLYRLGIVGLTVTLYLIGSTVSRVTLKTVGPRPLLQGVLLWIVVAVTSLLMIRRGLIGL